MKAVFLKSATRNIRRAPFQAMAAMMVLAITFFVVTLLGVITYGSGNLLKYFETRPQIIAFLKSETTEEEAMALKDIFTQDTRINKIIYVTKDDAFNIYKSATKDNPVLSELVNASVFPASLEMTLTDISYADGVVGDIKKSPVVDSVGITASIGGESTLGDVVGKLKSVTNTIRFAGFIAGGVLALTSFLVLMVIVSMRMVTRRDEVEILTLIGATSWFVRRPVLFEALLYAVVGTLVGWGGALIVLLYSAPSILTYFGDIPVIPKSPSQLFGLMGLLLFGEIVLGALIALLGSFVALARAQKRR